MITYNCANCGKFVRAANRTNTRYCDQKCYDAIVDARFEERVDLVEEALDRGMDRQFIEREIGITIPSLRRYFNRRNRADLRDRLLYLQ